MCLGKVKRKPKEHRTSTRHHKDATVVVDRLLTLIAYCTFCLNVSEEYQRMGSNVVTAILDDFRESQLSRSMSTYSA